MLQGFDLLTDNKKFTILAINYDCFLNYQS